MMNSTESAKRPSGKRPKKRKFTVHLQDFDSSFIEHDDGFDGYRVFDKTIIFTNIQNFASCKKCGGDIKLSEKCARGLSSVFSIECKNCEDLCSFRNSKMQGKRKKNIPEINRRFVYAMRTIGQGHAAMTTFCGVMEFPPPVAEKSYNNIINKLQLCSKEVAEASMQSAALEEVTLTNSSDIIISGDGTWKTCGYSSRVGVCAVIEDKTGKCIDAEVMSSFCKGYDSWKRRKGSPAYKKWKNLHVKECFKNHNGSAGMMETVGMIRIFQRSLSYRSVRYTSYIGGGDSKTFSSITASNPYGEDITVSKIECVGHVQKRMGTRLRKLKQMSSKLSDGKSIGGKGRLTDRMIDLITTYYGNAIRQNKTCMSDMRKAVWAVYFHIRSSDEEPLHSFCPDGRLQSGDHILQIGDVNLRGMGSEQVAMVLRQSGSHVRLIVARPVDPASCASLRSHAPLVPTRILADPEEVEKHLAMFNHSEPSPYKGPPTSDATFAYHRELDYAEVSSAPLQFFFLSSAEHFAPRSIFMRVRRWYVLAGASFGKALYFDTFRGRLDVCADRVWELLFLEKSFRKFSTRVLMMLDRRS
ncbi:patj homolog [Trichonephila clavipes]|uniref:Patj homolog n=1 Tax=Trichonephila clavipes TaxID=2585209 RepID=A0A8X6SQ17_TRICX|nr:patj homolog [Trichonephila clavipes]